MKQRMKERMLLGNLIILVPSVISLILGIVLPTILYMDLDYIGAINFATIFSMLFVVIHYNIWFQLMKNVRNVRKVKPLVNATVTCIIIAFVSLVVGILGDNGTCMLINFILTGVISCFAGFIFGNPKIA